MTFFDTADMYTQGESERLVGEAFRNDRQRIVIATKFGYVLPTQKRLGARIKPLLKPVVARLGLTGRHVPSTFRGTVARQDFSPAYIRAAIEDSLRRLRTDYIDIYQLHSPSREVLRRAEFVEPLERFREQGKIRYWGVACEHAEDVEDCLPFAQLASIQVGFSALEQAALDTAIPEAAARGIGIISRQVYASGLLTRPLGTFAPEQIDTDPAIADQKRLQIARFASIADDGHRSPAELALKFALAQAVRVGCAAGHLARGASGQWPRGSGYARSQRARAAARDGITPTWPLNGGWRLQGRPWRYCPDGAGVADASGSPPAPTRIRSTFAMPIPREAEIATVLSPSDTSDSGTGTASVRHDRPAVSG